LVRSGRSWSHSPQLHSAGSVGRRGRIFVGSSACAQAACLSPNQALYRRAGLRRAAIPLKDRFRPHAHDNYLQMSSAFALCFSRYRVIFSTSSELEYRALSTDDNSIISLPLSDL
jgi:hypothetical protein